MSGKRDRRGGRNDGGNDGSGATPSWDGVVGEEDSVPVDLNAVRADDEFIEALLSDPVVPTRSRVDYELAGLLSNWRAEVSAVPMPQQPTLEQVEAQMTSEARRDTQRHRSLRIVRYAGGAAAAVALVFGGVSVVAHNAAPGDPLWGVKEVMFGADASSTIAMDDVQADIERAAKAIALGDRSTAQTFLDSAQSRIKDVRDAGDRSSLQRKIGDLRRVLETPASTSSSTTPPTRGGGPAEMTSTQPSVPPVTVTAPQETVTVTPTEPTVVSEPPTSETSEPPPETVVSDPPTSETTEPPPSESSSVPVVPPG